MKNSKSLWVIVVLAALGLIAGGLFYTNTAQKTSAPPSEPAAAHSLEPAAAHSVEPSIAHSVESAEPSLSIEPKPMVRPAPPTASLKPQAMKPRHE